MDWGLPVIVAVCAISWTCTETLIQSKAQNIPDNRCYLENGASSESFFVPEDLPIGSVIGQIRIHGDPRPGGTISLHLREADSPVVLNGFRNLSLRRNLDKEGVSGPSSVFINLVCERLHTSDPVFTIPISIRVTDVNDNAPKFINAPYILNISEVTVVGTRVLQGVHAIDADQQGPFSSVRYSVLAGPHTEYFEFENELEGTLVLRKPLDYESLRSFDVGIRAQDHGEPPKMTDTILTVYVVDADDQNPRFLDDRYTAAILEPALQAALLSIKPRDIKAFDQDLGINAPIAYTFNGVGSEYSYFKINRATARISLARDLTTNELHHPVTLVIRATQQDNLDRYALATLTVSRIPGNPIRFLKHTFTASVSESIAVGTTLAVLTNTRTDEHLQYFVSNKEILETMAISPTGRLVLKKQLDYEQQTEYVFKVFATDGITNDSCVVNVTVEDVNEWDPQFRYSQYEFFVSGLEDDPIGRVEVGDGDTQDQLSLTLTGSNASMFYITPHGELRLRKLEEHWGVANMAVVASDNGNPPRRTTVPVIVHFQKGRDSKGLAAGRLNTPSPVFLATLGSIFFILIVVIAALVVYICKVRKAPMREQLTSPKEEKSQSNADKIGNPMFGDPPRSPTAGLSGYSGSTISKAKPSPKIHPAPLPPMWPASAIPPRVKKLSWNDDKSESGSADNTNNVHDLRKLTDSSNLTVYF